MRWTRIGMWLVALTMGLFALAQQEPTVIKVDVNVVNVLATVRDRHGSLIGNLNKDDFILEENGQKQEIRYFTHQTDQPLTIGLLVDTSPSQRNLIAEERSASYQFFTQVLRPDRDRAFVIKFDFDAELLQDLTNSLSSLQKSLNALKPPSMRRSANPDGRGILQGHSLTQIWPQSRPQSRIGLIGTVLFDAVFLAADEILQKQEGRKAIILISDGVDAGSTLSEKAAIEAAQRADTIIYSIRYYDWTTYERPGDIGVLDTAGLIGASTLQDLSKDTGGRMFEATKKLTLKDIYDKIQDELRNQYNIGYVPPKTGGSEFRRIKLRLKDGKYDVVTRAGYYPKK
jgi:VWFA-related protein